MLLPPHVEEPRVDICAVFDGLDSHDRLAACLLRYRGRKPPRVLLGMGSAITQAAPGHYGRPPTARLCEAGPYTSRFAGGESLTQMVELSLAPKSSCGDTQHLGGLVESLSV